MPPDPSASRPRRWRPGVEPGSRTAVAIAVGLVGVMVAERAATIAPVTLPLLLATGLLGSLVRHGWGGPGWTWVGATAAEMLGALAYLATRPQSDAQWDPLVPVFLAGGVALFAGFCFAGFAVVAVARRILAPRTADLAVVIAVAVLVALALLTIAAGPDPATAPPGAAASTHSSGRDGTGSWNHPRPHPARPPVSCNA